jgi:hypothetical protein
MNKEIYIYLLNHPDGFQLGKNEIPITGIPSFLTSFICS